jgi:hypothetical protein
MWALAKTKVETKITSRALKKKKIPKLSVAGPDRPSGPSPPGWRSRIGANGRLPGLFA